jgi:hypothetical protein
MVTQETSSMVNNIEITKTDFHKLNDIWNLWAHLPHDTDWSIKSYKKIYTIKYAEEAIAITETIPDVLVKNCMLFVMRNGITPVWEDIQNRNGGCFSYKIGNKNVYDVWKKLNYLIIGETISSQLSFVNCVTGITISPKKNFCIIKIWMRNCSNQDPSVITKEISELSSQGCLFKKHVPEY